MGIMSDQSDMWGYGPAQSIASGPYLCGDFVAHLRVIYDFLSNSATVTLMCAMGVELVDWSPVSSLVWCPGEEALVENNTSAEWLWDTQQLSFSRRPEPYHRFRGDAFDVLEYMFAYARHSETLKNLSTLTPERAAKLIEESDDSGLSERLEAFGTHNPYPLDGSDYEYHREKGTWEHLGSSFARLQKLDKK
jgi:hypothetical protein